MSDLVESASVTLGQLEDDLRYLMDRGSVPTHHCFGGCAKCELRAFAAYARLHRAVVYGRASEPAPDAAVISDDESLSSAQHYGFWNLSQCTHWQPAAPPTKDKP